MAADLQRVEGMVSYYLRTYSLKGTLTLRNGKTFTITLIDPQHRQKAIGYFSRENSRAEKIAEEVDQWISLAENSPWSLYLICDAQEEIIGLFYAEVCKKEECKNLHFNVTFSEKHPKQEEALTITHVFDWAIKELVPHMCAKMVKVSASPLQEATIATFRSKELEKDQDLLKRGFSLDSSSPHSETAVYTAPVMALLISEIRELFAQIFSTTKKKFAPSGRTPESYAKALNKFMQAKHQMVKKNPQNEKLVSLLHQFESKAELFQSILSPSEAKTEKGVKKTEECKTTECVKTTKKSECLKTKPEEKYFPAA